MVFILIKFRFYKRRKKVKKENKKEEIKEREGVLMKFLIFADLHNFEKKILEEIKEKFDIIVLLGDIKSSSIVSILNKYPNKPVYGVYGNHDNEYLYEAVNKLLIVEREMAQEPLLYPVNNLNLSLVKVDSVSFAGLQGAIKYNEASIGYTQEEALDLIIPAADILFSHETGYKFIKNEKGICHEGYEAVSKYIKKNKPKYHIFGHHHIDTHFKKHKTMCYGVYGCSLFDYDTGIIKKVF